MITPTQSLIQVRKLAEEAVADMPVGDLKVAAFQTILRSLLEQGMSIDSPRMPTPAKQQVAPEPKVASKATKNGTTSKIMELASEGFFKEQRSLADIQKALEARGWYYAQENLGTPLTRLTRKKALRRVGVLDGSKRIWKYSQ